MSEYLHGAYGRIQTAGSRVAADSQSAIVYIGTAPVHTIEGGAERVNKPVVVRSIAEAKRLFGYSDDWASYSLCEAMHAHLVEQGVGPLVLINVLDPAEHRASTASSQSMTPVNGRIIIPSAESIILDSLSISTIGEEPEEKVKGTDYTAVYSQEKKTITITELSAGALGTDALTVSYNNIDAASVTAADVIGSTDGNGMNTGLYAVKDVYSVCGMIPSYLGCPGFSSVPAVHAALIAVSQKINGHWDAYCFVDLPIVDGETQITMESAAAWKSAHGYTAENETVYFPMAKSVDGKIYHLSVLAAANFQALLLDNDGLPYNTASNTACALIEGLYLGESYTGRVFDDSIINAKLNCNGIASAAYLGGRWVIWGAHSADYDQQNADAVNVSETNRMMLYYISNDFQHRRFGDVDKPTTANALRTMASEEQTRLDALVRIGALLYGEVVVDAVEDDRSDRLVDFSFSFNVTVTPLARSLTAVVNWTDAGFVTYFQSLSLAEA